MLALLKAAVSLGFAIKRAKYMLLRLNELGESGSGSGAAVTAMSESCPLFAR